MSLPEWKTLLHYKNGKSAIGAGSSFFLSLNGYKDPNAELEATITALLNDPKAQCKYPARLDFLLENGALTSNQLPKSDCEEYEIYLQKVPFERIYAVFVAEDQSNPASIMGHTILKIVGQDSDGITREHSFSFMALMNENGNLKRYVNTILNGSEGSYVLAPYHKTIETYIYNEQRSLWEFELNLSLKAKKRLRKHLWEIKETPILYQFITHNCNTAIEMVLSAADTTFSDNKHWLFSTPIEYLQELDQKDKIKSVFMQPSKSDREAIVHFGTYYPLDTPSVSRVTIEGFDGGFRLGMLPSYRDKRTVSNAGIIEYDSKILELEARFDKNSVNLERLNLIALESIGDYRIIGSSKAFRLALEESRQKHLGSVFEWGRGIGFSPLNDMTIYTIGKMGAIYDGEADFFAMVNTGIIAYFGTNAKLLASYEHFWDSNVKYRDFKKQLNIFTAYAPFSYDWDIYTGLKLGSNGSNSHSETVLSVGFSIYF
ncbi:MAG: DUF4105 domain-containing protein [Campylobacteraceae bacterium]|jgi:hypothetical protein|nr:DUF4105 domain-containing protein [Campylobacteraceae bacterium]